jgi:hypothetical protein
MNKVFLAISGLFAAIPGFAIMWKGIGTPPDYTFLFGGVVEAFGCLSLLLLWMNRVKIRKIESRKIVKAAIILGLSGFISIITYIILFNVCVVSHPTNHTVFFPLWLSGQLENMVTMAGGRWAALDYFGWFGIYQATQNTPVALALTAAILLFVYQAIFSTLAIAFGLVGFHKGEGLGIGDKEQKKTP